MESRSAFCLRNPSLLTLQHNHRSSMVWNGDRDTILKCRQGGGSLQKLLANVTIHHSVLELIQHWGFYGVLCLGVLRLDRALITAMVERWRPETHTFHLPIGEATITLEDVRALWGLPVNGIAICEKVWDGCCTDWKNRVEDLLGFIPLAKDIRYNKIRITSIANHLCENPITDDEDPNRIVQYARGLVMLMLGGVLFATKDQNMMPLFHLQALQDVENIPKLSWGSAVLAFLYRELCNNSQGDPEGISGPLQLLMVRFFIV